MKIDIKRVENEFVSIIQTQSETRQVEPTDLVLVIFPEPKRGSYVARCRIFSKSNAFNPEVVKLNALTQFDASFIGRPVSKSFLQIFKAEIYVHNVHFDKGNLDQGTVKNIPEKLTLDGFECYIEVQPVSEPSEVDGEYKLAMNFIHNHRFFRKYDLLKEFSMVHGQEVNDNEIEKMREEMADSKNKGDFNFDH